MYLLSLDEGTTSARALIFDRNLAVVACAQREISQQYPQAGWVEEDPEEIWQAQRAVLVEAVGHLDRGASKMAGQIAAIGIANQRETTIVWDRKTGKAIYPAIVWQDRRTATFCRTLADSDAAKLIRERTGLVIDPYFSATKIAWILDNVPDARARAANGELAFGTVDSWLVWKLPAGLHHVTDASNASRTLLFNLQTGAWDDELLREFRIPHAVLPQIVDTSQQSGIVSTIPECPGVPIAGIVGDQQGALFGQGCFEAGQSKCTYGTGCFLLQNIGTQNISEPRQPSGEGILTTVAWRIAGKDTFALEGSVFIGGAVVQWLRDGLRIISSASESERLAAEVPDTDGVFFVPAFTGMGAPYWNPNARGLIVGLTRGTTTAHIARAALESIAFQVADLVEAMNGTASVKLSSLRADGGAAANKLLMQFQAELLGIPVAVPLESEATALGAACLAGLAVGCWSSREELAELIGRRASSHYAPQLPRNAIVAKKLGWHQAVKKALL